MLIIRAYVNHEKIDEVWIINTGRINKEGEHIYEIRMPEGFNNLRINHKRSKGWKSLAVKVLELIEERK